jgi:hypothetical protein
MASAAPARSSRAWSTASHTPAACQSRSRRQAVAGLTVPGPRGVARHGAPAHTTNRIAHRAARSSAKGRPPLGWGAGGDSSGAISAQRSSTMRGMSMRGGCPYVSGCETRSNSRKDCGSCDYTSRLNHFVHFRRARSTERVSQAFVCGTRVDSGVKNLPCPHVPGGRFSPCRCGVPRRAPGPRSSRLRKSRPRTPSTTRSTVGAPSFPPHGPWPQALHR